MRKGDIFLCRETVIVSGNILFEKDKEYKVLYVDNEKIEVMVCLDHILYTNKYQSFPIDFIYKNFKKLK